MTRDPLTPEQLEALFESGSERPLSEDDRDALREDSARSLVDLFQELQDARELSEKADEKMPARGLRATALLTVRCGDCRRSIIAHVTIIGGRPMLWVRGGAARSFVDIADPPPALWGDRAHCRAGHEYPIAYAMIEEFVREGSGRHAEITVSHNDTGAVRYR